MKVNTKLVISIFLVVAGISTTYYLNQSNVDDKKASSAEVSTDVPNKNVASENGTVASPTTNITTVEGVNPNEKTAGKDVKSPIPLKTNNNNTPVIKPVSIAFKDAVRKLEKKETVQLKRTLADGSVVMDTVQAETSATVVVISEDGTPIQGHGGLVLNAPEINLKKPK